MDFGRFEQSLRQAWGEDAALARHEIYFISRRKRGWLQIAHAAAALLRDAWLCAHLPSHTERLSATVCAVSLAGTNGWGSISPLLPTLQATGQAVSVLIHPRLQGTIPGSLPAAPDRMGWQLAILSLFKQSRATIPVVSPWTVRCCLARRQLWRSSLRRTVTGAGSEVRAILLHNDFDLFSAAAVESAREMPQIRSLCIQHGLPTDEFFPTRADVQLVWGNTSRDAYLSHNTPLNTLAIGTYRAKPPISLPRLIPAPRRILLISQTHTPVYGCSLENGFLGLAIRLDAYLDDQSFRILLHPEESRLGHPYGIGNMASRCRHPPHAELAPQEKPLSQPALVLGFCSTALAEAAQAGNFVLGLNWEVPASKAAMAVGSPPFKIDDAEAAVELFERLLRDHEFRSEWMRKQTQWINNTFIPLPEDWLHECLISGRRIQSGDEQGT
jgi:hypothetical protein